MNKKRLGIKLNKSPVLYFVLFALYPILALYSDNIDQDPNLWQIAFLLIILIGAISISIFLFINYFIKDSQKAGLIVLLLVFLFYCYGYFFDYFYRIGILKNGYNLSFMNIQILSDHIWIWSNKILLSISFFLFLIAIIYILRRPTPLTRLTNFLNILAILLILISIISIGSGLSSQIFSTAFKNNNTIAEAKDLSIKGNCAEYPDIYYIFLDMYPSSRALKSFYNYDNSYFEDHLLQNGFLVANNSRPNYQSDVDLASPTTFYLASTLNMNYLDNISEMQGAINNDIRVPYDLIKNNQVIKFLKSKGYTTVNIASSFAPTESNPYADLNLGNTNFLSADQENFVRTYFRNTMFYPFYLFHFKSLDDQDRVLFEFYALEQVHSINHPKFVMADFFCPHPPFIFGKNGEKVIESGGIKNEKESYLDQLTFMNKKLMDLSDKLVLQSQDYPMIIIIQSDHGAPYHRTNWGDKDAYLTPEVLQGSLTNFNAYYLPGKADIRFNSITPVNLFRLIFDSYLGANYSLLDDRIYFSTDKQYEFIDVTERIIQNPTPTSGMYNL